MDVLQIIIPFITAIVGIFIGYYLNQALYDRKRKDELADREFNRRIKARDDRLQEAQAFLNAYREAIRSLVELEREMLVGLHPEKYEDNEFDKLRVLTRFTQKRLSSIKFLNDAELNELNDELVSSFLKEKAMALELKMWAKENAGSYREDGMRRVSDFYERSVEIMRKMQSRLDKLDETLP